MTLKEEVNRNMFDPQGIFQDYGQIVRLERV